MVAAWLIFSKVNNVPQILKLISKLENKIVSRFALNGSHVNQWCRLLNKGDGQRVKFFYGFIPNFGISNVGKTFGLPGGKNKAKTRI